MTLILWIAAIIGIVGIIALSLYMWGRSKPGKMGE